MYTPALTRVLCISKALLLQALNLLGMGILHATIQSPSCRFSLQNRL